MTTCPTFTALAENAQQHDAERRKWVLITAASAMGVSVEADIADIQPGELKMVEWRGKPVWLMRRTPEMLAGC